jgi:hypothetical protein
VSPADGTTPALERAELDYYPTPRWVVDAILPHLPRVASVFDPACGIGDLLEAFRQARREGIEIDADRALLAAATGSCIAHGDALKLQWPDADLCILNPPYRINKEPTAEAFVRRALAWRAVDPRRTVAALLRLSFLEPTDQDKTLRLPGRADLHDKYPPEVYVLPERPRFRGDTKGTDNVTSAWFVYGPGRAGGRLVWL